MLFTENKKGNIYLRFFALQSLLWAEITFEKHLCKKKNLTPKNSNGKVGKSNDRCLRSWTAREFESSDSRCTARQKESSERTLAIFHAPVKFLNDNISICEGMWEGKTKARNPRGWGLRFFTWDSQPSCPHEILSVIKWSSCLHCWIYSDWEKRGKHF